MNYDDEFTQETVWEQLRLMWWLGIATLGVVCMILSVAL